MKKRYSIGFFAAFFLIISLLAIGYQLSYQYRMDKQEAKSAKEENTQFISTKGETTKNEGYYLKELHGYVAVYLSDGETLYELTEISCSSLPKEVQEAVRTGKYVETTRELYGFWKTTPVRKIHLDEIPQIVYDMQLEKVRNFEMDELKIARINELYRKSKAEGLTEAEKEEQKLLRAEYIESIRRNLRSQLDNIDIQEKDGSITNLGDKFDRKKRAN